MAKVRKRTWTTKDGQKTAWLVDYKDQDGKRRFQTHDKKKDADAALIDIQGEIKQGTHTPTRASITVAEAADIWIARGEREKLERSTLSEYRRHAERYIKPAIGTIKLAKLTTPGINEFLDHLLQRGSRAMARKVLTSLKGMVSEAQRRGLIAHNPALPVKAGMKKREQRVLVAGHDFPSKAEANTILAHAAGRWQPFFRTAIFTGMRGSELRGLTWADVDFDKKVINVRQRANLWGEIGLPKSKAGQREIPMLPMVISALKEWKVACPAGDLVFPNSRGEIESHTQIARAFEAIQRRARMVSTDGTKYGLHSLRHWYASWAIELGFTPKRLQVLLGHSSIRMTLDVYGHLFPSLEDDHAKFAAGELALLNAV